MIFLPTKDEILVPITSSILHKLLIHFTADCTTNVYVNELLIKELER